MDIHRLVQDADYQDWLCGGAVEDQVLAAGEAAQRRLQVRSQDAEFRMIFEPRNRALQVAGICLGNRPAVLSDAGFENVSEVAVRGFAELDLHLSRWGGRLR